MNSRSLKVAVFCGLWIFTGIMIALQVSSYFWWVGILAGVGGYFTWESSDVVRAIPMAWRKATQWRPDVGKCKKFILCVFYFFICSASLTICLILLIMSCVAIIAMFTPITPIAPATPSNQPLRLATLISALLFVAVLPAIFFSLRIFETDEEGQKNVLDHCRELATVNLVTICFHYLPLGVYMGACWLTKQVAASTKVFGRFTWYLFKMIHSDDRMLVGVYISSFVAIGYLIFHNAIAGALVGGILSYAGREIISKRILKIIPIRNGK